MIHPSYSELIEAINTNNEDDDEALVLNSRYSLVLAASKRARQLIAGAEPLVADAAGKKPLSVAIDELYEGKVKDPSGTGRGRARRLLRLRRRLLRQLRARSQRTLRLLKQFRQKRSNFMKILFISLGCDKNLVDSEEMLGLLTANGHEIVDDETEADVIVINTCCFIQ